MSQLILPGTAGPSDVLAGKTFSAGTHNGTFGTMPNRGTPTFTPGTANQALPAGYYAGGTVAGDPNLLAANILSGTSIFGVAGTVIAGKRFASGTVSGNSSALVSVTDLAFKPAVVVIMTGTTSKTESYSLGGALLVMVDPNLFGNIGGAYSGSGSKWYRPNYALYFATNTGSGSTSGGAVSNNSMDPNATYPTTNGWHYGIDGNGFRFMPTYETTQTYWWIAYGF